MDIRSNGSNKIITLLILSIVLTVIASALRCIAGSVFNAIMRKKLYLVSLPRDDLRRRVSRDRVSRTVQPIYPRIEIRQ